MENNELDFVNIPLSEDYDDGSIIHLEWNDHIRTRPGMYIGKAGDGSAHDDGIYILLKEIIDNCIDEYVMGFGKSVEINIIDGTVRVRDYGRGIPLGSLKDCVGKMNTGGKYDSKAFKKSVGLNGVGTKAVNATSSHFKAQAYRDGKTKYVEYSKGVLLKETEIIDTEEKNGTEITFTPDKEVFGNYHYIMEYVEEMIWNYAFLNSGLALYVNGQKYQSKNGLYDLLMRKIGGKEETCAYPIIHIKEGDFECAFTHSNLTSNEEYFSFANGQYNPLGGTHLNVFREAMAKTIREFYNKDYEISDIRSSLVAAISIKVMNPEYEGQTKTKFSSTLMEPDGMTIRAYITDIIKRHFDKFLHINQEVAEALMRKILQNEKERKGMANIKKLAKESAKKVSLNNKKLRECRIHYNTNHEKRLETTLFITEGDSASGSITKSRDAQTQAVFSLRGKPLNCLGLTKKVVYENEEFNLLQAALNIDESIENLRYNNIVIATDADVDGYHIRNLVITYFMKFFDKVIKDGRLFVLETPLFRVRDKKTTYYCYNETEKQKALAKIGKSAETTRFKGLGEINPKEFKDFIGEGMRLTPIDCRHDVGIPDTLQFYMGGNTRERRQYILDNLVLTEEFLHE